MSKKHAGTRLDALTYGQLENYAAKRGISRAAAVEELVIITLRGLDAMGDARESVVLALEHVRQNDARTTGTDSD